MSLGPVLCEQDLNTIRAAQYYGATKKTRIFTAVTLRVFFWFFATAAPHFC